MGTNNICLYKEVDKTYTSCNLKTTEWLDCALILACAVIRMNTVVLNDKRHIHLLLDKYIYFGYSLEAS